MVGARHMGGGSATGAALPLVPWMLPQAASPTALVPIGHISVPTSSPKVATGIIPNISKEALSRVYHLPQTEAATALNTSVRKIKQLCSLYNISRWPHRALQSLDKLCSLVEEESAKMPTEESVREMGRRFSCEDIKFILYPMSV